MKPGRKPIADAVRFERHYQPIPWTGCWLWTGTTKRDGYGMFRDSRQGMVQAHRFSYEQINGVIPAPLEIDHLCKVRNCVNPQHMEAVTHAVNVRRSSTKTHCKHGHELSESNCYFSKGRRDCRTCKRKQHRAAYWKRNAI